MHCARFALLSRSNVIAGIEWNWNAFFTLDGQSQLLAAVVLFTACQSGEDFSRSSERVSYQAGPVVPLTADSCM